jgi:hypothetical protein
MYDDLFNEKQDPSVVSKDQLIEAMKENIKEKEELINQLMEKIGELEGALQGFNECMDMNKY